MSEFIKWVSDQPCHRVINHDSWHSCALGDYARSIAVNINEFSGLPEDWANTFGVLPRQANHLNVCIDTTKNLILPETTQIYKTLYDVLGDGKYNISDKYDISTYGGLLELINNCTLK